MDEPTSALDEKNKTLILNLLRKIQNQTQMAYLLITHDMNVVEQMADEVIILENGRFVEKGTFKEILKKPKQEYTRNLLNSAFLS